MPIELSSAISLLTENKIQVKAEVLYKIEGETEVKCLWIFWSPITQLAGRAVIESIIGDDYVIGYWPNQNEFRITLKK